MGSPREVNTNAMVEAFKGGAEEAGHEVNGFKCGQDEDCWMSCL